VEHCGTIIDELITNHGEVKIDINGSEKRISRRDTGVHQQRYELQQGRQEAALEEDKETEQGQI